MDYGWAVAIPALVTGAVVLLVLAGFWYGLVRPHLDRKVKELIEASQEIEPKIRQGVREGVEETLRDLPESAANESTRQFLRFGSGLFENGLSSFLGEVTGPDKKPGK